MRDSTHTRPLFWPCIVFTLGLLAATGCNETLETEGLLFACQNADDCLPGFFCQSNSDRSLEPIFSRNRICQRCRPSLIVQSPASVRTPTCFDAADNDNEQTPDGFTLSFDCNAIDADMATASNSLLVYGNIRGTYEGTVTVGAEGQTLTFSLENNMTFAAGERITVLTRSGIRHRDSGVAVKTSIVQFVARSSAGVSQFIYPIANTPQRVAMSNGTDLDAADFDQDGAVGLVHKAG